MKIAIMQPYLFPYLGYFQLINAVDVFVFLDDVQFIKKGWINRNKILIKNEPQLFTLSIKKDSSKKLINERCYASESFEENKAKILKTIYFSYKKCPYFSEVYDLLSGIFDYNNFNLVEFNTNSLKIICCYLGIDTNFLISSQINKNNNLKGQELVIEINRVLGSDHYINSIGGRNLYSKTRFFEAKISLKFIKMNEIQYSQGNFEFFPNLSIIDILMWNSKKDIQSFLKDYILI